jgi:hypothetical protein
MRLYLLLARNALVPIFGLFHRFFKDILYNISRLFPCEYKCVVAWYGYGVTVNRIDRREDNIEIDKC